MFSTKKNRFLDTENELTGVPGGPDVPLSPGAPGCP